MKISKLFSGLAVVAASLFLLSACGSSSSEDTSVSDIKDKGTLVVALNPEFAPFEFKTLVDGKDTIVGADVEIAKAIAEERKKAYDFSAPYYEAENVVLIRKTDIDKYTDTDSLDGLSVGTQKGSIQETVASEQLTGAKVVSLTQNSEMINELKNSQIEAVVLEKPIAEGYVANNSDLTISDITLTSDDADAYAVAFAKGTDQDLIDTVNDVIKKAKDSGDFDAWLEKAATYTQSSSSSDE